MSRVSRIVLVCAVVGAAGVTRAAYTNFEASHVHPIALTPSRARLLAVNTPDAMLEVFDVQPGGGLAYARSIPVGLEPVTVHARTETEAWVVNQLSGSVSVVDLVTGVTLRTLRVGAEPTDVDFAGGRAYVTVSQEDAVKAYDLDDFTETVIPLFGDKPRALAVSPDGTRVYAVVLLSGNQTTVVNGNIVFGNNANLDAARMTALGLNNVTCSSPPPPYPPLPAGVVRNPALTDPPDGIPKVGLIVGWNPATLRWEDEVGQNWNACLPFRLPDRDLFVIDATATPPAVIRSVDHLGTSLFEVSVNPASGKIYVPHTEARNRVRFELPQGVRGHVVDDRLAIVDPGSTPLPFGVTLVDLNTHIDRGSDPAAKLAERQRSLSQPGMMVWNAAGTQAYLTAIGSRKLFRVDAACATGACIFGPDRNAPAVADVGEGPTGVALQEAAGRLYVMLRFSNSIAVVNSATLGKLGEVALHDASPATVRAGRRFLYDAIDGSGHGDAACSSCHLSGDRDGLSWDLGDPTGSSQPYATANDNVRFIVPVSGTPTTCPSPGTACASHQGHDPQKGPMATQTLRGMLEPLHWRGDRATMNNFNKAFPGLMGTADIGPINGEPAGLPAPAMESFRQFALGVRFPPNPHRNVDDTLPNNVVTIPDHPVSGNPAIGEVIFNTFPTDANQPCTACHALPFGAAGGTLGGVTPVEPTSNATAALFNGNADQSRHSDLKVPHLRNMYEKFGPRFGDGVSPPPLAKSGFGFVHDGTVPDLATFLSINVFNMTAQQVRDVSTFLMFFPTGTRPATGQMVTLPAGTPPTGTPQDESLVSTLIGLGDAANAGRHCELVASAELGGERRSFRLQGGSWIPDASGDIALTTIQLRQAAESPLTFLCATLGAGARLGGDRDEDARLDADDCAPADAGAWSPPTEVSGLSVFKAPPPTHLAWGDQAAQAGPGVRYDLASGTLSGLRAGGLDGASTCLAGDLAAAGADDWRPAAPPGNGYYYLVRAQNSCATAGFGPGRASLDALACP
ncbi:MAG TPA: hypothetical protein VJS92_11925 [Candidatus Polarisedimenticolaceae bacterium]|nr:hypothetical protein [Candidatus Polarisedimenticolaceae bacterium]